MHSSIFNESIVELDNSFLVFVFFFIILEASDVQSNYFSRHQIACACFGNLEQRRRYESKTVEFISVRKQIPCFTWNIA